MKTYFKVGWNVNLSILLIFGFLFLTIQLFSQTLVKYDNIENYNWSGGWSVGYGNNTGYYTNVFVSSNSSAALIGAGNGTSNIEEGLYILPNVTGLSPANQYELRFRLGSYKFSSPSAATAGVDVPDYVLVYVSYDNSTLIQEMKITGYSSSLWNYNSTLLQKSASGILTTYSAQTATYSDIRLSFSNASQFTSRIYVRVNSAGEEWWLDNFELWLVSVPLPVELISFDGDKDSLWWDIYSEWNNDYYTIYHSEDGNSFSEFAKIDAILTPHYSIKNSVGGGYFKLFQTDYDGKEKYLAIIYIFDDKSRYIKKIVNTWGQEVDKFEIGHFYLVFYSDGTVSKIYHD